MLVTPVLSPMPDQIMNTLTGKINKCVFMIKSTQSTNGSYCLNKTCHFTSKCPTIRLPTECDFACEGTPVASMLLPLASSHHLQSSGLHLEGMMACDALPHFLTTLTIPSMHSYTAHRV